MFVIASAQPWHRKLADDLAARTGLPFTLIDSKDDLTADRLSALGAEMVFLPHWSHIIPSAVFDHFECVIFHMTDLPYGRGGSPLQNLIVRGHETTMITALRCAKGIDTGPVYTKRPLSLHGSAQEIFLRASDVIADMIGWLANERPQPIPQDDSAETESFRRRTPEQGDWSAAQNLKSAYDHIRMLDAEGYPPAFVDVGKFRLEFARASLRDGELRADVRIIEIQSNKED